ncbi:MAG: preprotein translocase subunit YajC [Acidobacteria bacterium]|nr:MAG: preprotein translocase subunit YajC [Acidobacteriota bacterium]
MGTLAGLMPLVLIMVIFYVLIILPERKRRKKLQELINNLKVGDKVVTSGGIYGTILSLRDDRLIIKSDQAKLEISRNAVAGLQAEAGSEASPR